MPQKQNNINTANSSLPPNTQDNLTTKALLGAISQILQITVRLFTGFVVTPIIIHSLGKELYGTWVMIQQALGYIELTDLRASSTMKFTLSVDQHRNDFRYKRQQIGASLLAIFQVIPFIISSGIVTIWFAPMIIQTSADYMNQARWALGIGVICIIVTEFASIPGNILRGMNLEYKAIGLQAIVAAITSGFVFAAAWFETGLIGLSGALVVAPLITGIVQYFIIKINIPWLGAEWPSKESIRRFWSQTVWIFLASMGYVMQNASDLLVAGIILSPTIAALYGTTGAVLRMLVDPLYAIIGAANPGIAGLCGQQAWRRVEQIRHEIHLFAFFIMITLGVGVVILNKTFISIWLGPTYYYGNELNFLLVILALQNIPLRLDTMLMDGMLKFKERAISTIATSAIGFAIGAVLARTNGINGLTIGIIIGRFFAILIYQFIIEQGSGITFRAYLQWMGKAYMIGLTLLIISYFLSPNSLSILTA
jgi:O-antigen/teichoic acid export membrane protein